MLLPVFHLSVAMLDAYTLWYDQTYVDIPFAKEITDQKLPFKNRLLFLTVWCLVLQTVYFTIAFLNDIFGTNAPRKTSIIRVVKDSVFSLAFPIALYVSATFWGIYFIDKDLIFPEHVAKVFPVWMNQVMHTLIAPFICLELLLTYRNYPTRRVSVAISMVFTLSYIVFLNFVYAKTGSWVYPVLDVLIWPARILFFAVSVLAGVGVCIVGEKLNYLLSPSASKEVNGKVKRR